MHDTTPDADDRTVRLTDAERACMLGHGVERERLKELGRDEEYIDRLLYACDSYEDFSRCVQDSHRWEREHEGGE